MTNFSVLYEIPSRFLCYQHRWEAGLDVQEREWVSKERGNTIMLALLVRVD